ncbi:MAG: hypothetical protein J0H99_16730, partial [Rhodospirillales bacterium]|nr:hypothetical protein [Rhodospirillales bacterium]
SGLGYFSWHHPSWRAAFARAENSSAARKMKTCRTRVRAATFAASAFSHPNKNTETPSCP